MLSIKFPGFEVWGAPYRVGHPNGLYVKPGGFSGFDSLPTGRRDALLRPVAHGEFDLPVFRGPRVPSVEGIVIARSEFDLANWRDLITGCGADGQLVDVYTDHLGEVLRLSARVVEAPFTDRGIRRYGRLIADFSIHMVCPDPRKYGESRSFLGSSVQVHHYGNFLASPVVEVAGPRTGPYTIMGPGGRQVVVTQSLTAGQMHRIDFRTGRIYRNGSLQLGALGRAQFWAIPPGQRVTMGISAGSMTVRVADTYM